MAINRYRKRGVTANASPEYRDLLKKRDKSSIIHLLSGDGFAKIKIEDIVGAQLVSHIWGTGDRYYKLAAQYYGDPTYWWVIALFNNKPLETDLAAGDIVVIPVPLEIIISAMEV